MLLLRAARSLGLHGPHSLQPLPLITRRGIFNPDLTPPSVGQQFRVVLEHREITSSKTPSSNPEYSDLIDAKYLSQKAERSERSNEMWGQTPAERWRNKALRNTQSESADTYAGRTVDVIQGDVGQAYNRLQSILRVNNVRKELRLAERHEKKGVKRRRLRSERWKRKFADEVRQKVKLVNEIRLRDRMWGSRH